MLKQLILLGIHRIFSTPFLCRFSNGYFSEGLFYRLPRQRLQLAHRTKVLRVYGPGGPHHVLQECADLFLERSGVDVAIIKALPYDLKRKLPEDGDIYYGGAEYMLEEFDRQNPGILDVSTTEKTTCATDWYYCSQGESS